MTYKKGLMQSITESGKMITKEDVYDAIKDHPGSSTKELMEHIGLAISTIVDRQRVSSTLRTIKSHAEKLQSEGKIEIEEKVDRFAYFPRFTQKNEVEKNE